MIKEIGLGALEGLVDGFLFLAILFTIIASIGLLLIAHPLLASELAGLHDTIESER